MGKTALFSSTPVCRSGRPRTRLFVLPTAFVLVLALCPLLMAQSSSGPDWSQARSALGFQGQTQGNVLKISFVRQETITVQGKTVPPALVLEGFIAEQFAGRNATGSQALVFGEFPVRDEEVENFKTALVRAGVNVSALHNHELQDVPPFKYVHIEAFGDAAQLSKGIRAALDSTRASYKDISSEDEKTAPGETETKNIMPSDAMVEGREGIIDVELDRKDAFTSCAASITSRNGAGQQETLSGDLGAGALAACETAGRGRIDVEKGAVAFSDITINWQGGSGDVDADLSLRANEVNPVLSYLEQNGFRLSALHNHTLTVKPDIFFLHMSSSGDVLKALRALRSAWNATGGRSTTGR